MTMCLQPLEPVAAPAVATPATRRFAVLAGFGLLLAGCTGPADAQDATTTGSPTLQAPSAQASDEPGEPPESPEAPPLPADVVRQAGEATAKVQAETVTVASGLRSPWGLAALADGRFLVTLRDDASLVVVDRDGRVTPVGGPGADQLADQTWADGEAGLLGVAVEPGTQDPVTVYLYRSGREDNAVVRAQLTFGAQPELGELTTVLAGIPRASHHDGGRIAFGPDGFLYVATGDAGQREAAQDPGSLSGKILRITADGEPAPGNPDPGSAVWSLGHRNVQGLGWDSAGNLIASEFGQDTWDELNQIWPGGNYGWPTVEGAGGDAREASPVTGPVAQDGFVRPLMVWKPAAASPSGIAVTADAVYLAGLRGQRLWRVPLQASEAGAGVLEAGAGQVLLDDEGRLRDVVADEDGSLWVLTNNTDGRGDPREGDDRLLHVVVTPG